jgi:hypothetical protein
MRAISYAVFSVLVLNLFVAGCTSGGQERITSPSAPKGPATTPGNDEMRAPGPMTPDKMSGGGADERRPAQ